MDKDTKEIYDIWRGVKRRSGLSSSGYSKLSTSYYEKNKVTLDEAWLNFETFKQDMGLRPSKDHSVDRINNLLGYSKTNCRWATKKEQAVNRSTNVWLEYRGKRKTVSQWAEELDMPFGTFQARVEALFANKRPKNQKIVQKDKVTGVILNIFENGKEAMKVSKVSQSAIRKCLCEHNATAGGFKWVYFKE